MELCVAVTATKMHEKVGHLEIEPGGYFWYLEYLHGSDMRLVKKSNMEYWVRKKIYLKMANYK